MTERGREKVNEQREGRRKQEKEEGKEKGGKKRKRNICLYYACVFPSMNTVIIAKKNLTFYWQTPLEYILFPKYHISLKILIKML